VGDFDAKLRPHLESLLDPGEALLGICACSQQKSLFKGGAVAIGVTRDRLIVQPLSRRGEPAGDALSLAPGDIASADAEGAGGGWPEIGPAILDHAALRLRLRLADGEKLNLMLMRGEGALGLGKLGGGESQRRGVEALAAWFEGAAPTP
jgi:hypothetical protein